ncbi:MAG TPA: replication initiator protein A [Candidatus Paceibacterota bacterium]|nr:replication initiator protein A [Candidatus Paceibacterota bacterium]
MKEPKEIIIKNNNEIDLPKIINSEVNLLVFPFFSLSTKGLKNKTTTIYQEIIKKGNQEINLLWKVSSNSEYGYPGPFDRKVQQAISEILSEILKKEGEIKNPIPLGSLYNLCKRMNISYSGADYKKIKEAFKRIKTTSIESKGTFYSKDKKQWLEDIFSLYDRVIFKGEKISDNEISDNNYLFLGSWYLQNLNCFYIKPVDYDYLQTLKSKIASRLYEILGVKFYGLRNKREKFICYRYSKLCQLLPVTPHSYISLAKQQLDPGNNELIDTGFISKFDWSENGNKDWLIYYWPGERAKEEMKRAKIKSINNRTGEYLLGPKREVKIFSEEQAKLVNKLLELNVSKVTAEKLIKNNDQELIKKWIEAINYSNAGDKAAYLVKAIRENWQFPEEYLREKREEQRKEEEEKIEYIKIKMQEERNKKRQEEIKKIEQIYHSLDPSQQEEIRKETENRLPDFWKEKLNKGRVKGTTSKLLEVVLEEKRREIIKEWISSGRIKV